MNLFQTPKPEALPEIFSKFAGVEIPTKAVPIQVGFNQHVYVVQQPTEAGIEILENISLIANKNNINLRLWLPNSMGTMDIQHDRLNIKVKAESTSKWRIQNKCTYG